jgi:CBS domain-containing protein
MPRVLRDIMTKYVVTIDANGTALEAAKLMAEKGISSLIVLNNQNPFGIVT